MLFSTLLLILSSILSLTSSAVFENVTLTLTSRYVKFYIDEEPPVHAILITSDNTLEEYVNGQPLEIVRLNHQQIVQLTENSISNLPKVEEVEIVNSALKTIQPGAFTNLPKLEYLNLTHNLLEEIQDGVFFHLPSLDSVHLEHNRIARLGDAVFANLPRLNHIFMDHNQLKTWRSSWFTGSRVESISMAYNLVEEFPAEAFTYYRDLHKGYDSRLWYLILSDNNLKSIHPDAFWGLTEIAYLNLKNNSLQTLPAGLFRGVKGINNLVLSDNRIANIEVGRVFNRTELTYVKLLNNGLSCISLDIAEVNEVYEMNLDGNPISCECITKWEQWQKKYNKTVFPLDNLKNCV